MLWNKSFSFTSSIHFQRRFVYWPPPANKRSRCIHFASGKKAFVFNGKRDCDGQTEPLFCFLNSANHKLIWFDQEEFNQLKALAPRLKSYMELWQSKAELENERQKEWLENRERSDRYIRSD